MYKPSMPERPNPVPPPRRKIKIAVRPKPETIISLSAACERIYKPSTPDEIIKRNEEITFRRAAKLATPAPQKQVVMIAREYTPPQSELREQVVDIMGRMGRGEIDHQEATHQMLEAIAAPVRVRISQIAADYQHQLSEIEERYEVAG